MAFIEESKRTFLTVTYDGGAVRHYDSDVLAKVSYVPPRVSGQFVTFPDGSRFRLATGQSKYKGWWTGSTGENTAGAYPFNPPWSTVSSAGGWAPDLLTSLCPSVIGSSGGPQQLVAAATTPDEMRNEAVTKALLKIADQKAGIGEDLATFRQTAGLLSHPCSSLLGSLKKAWNDKSLRPFLNSTVRELRKDAGTRAIAEKYLEYVYGWLPLMGDIHGIIELAKKQGVRPLLVHGKGSSVQQSETTEGTYMNFSSGYLTQLGPLNQNGHVSCHLWGRIDPDAAGMRSLNQLGLLNPISLVWDLIPWSFVVDWFVPIGHVLEALTAPAGLIFVDGTISAKWTMTGPYSAYWNKDGPPNREFNPASGTAHHESWRRDILTQWPLPGLYLSANPFSGDRPFKALALGIANLRNLRV